MRSNNFFDQFNDEIGNAAIIASASLVVIGLVLVLTIGAGCFWLLQ